MNHAPEPSALEALESQIAALESVLVCYSGGIDSALVLAVAVRVLGPRAIALTAVSPSLPSRELEEAKRIAVELGARHEIVHSRELDRPGYQQNGPDRCFHCKTELYALAAEQRALLGLGAIVNGTNKDDLGDHRPGLTAAERAGIRSPLLELGLGKAEVRALAHALGLPIWDKPAAACLSSRIPYGTPVTRERLAQVEELERALQDLGFGRVRVRYHGPVARVEVEAAELARLVEPATAAAVTRAGRAAGFDYVTADLLGYRTGSQNEVLGRRGLPVVS